MKVVSIHDKLEEKKHKERLEDSFFANFGYEYSQLICDDLDSQKEAIDALPYPESLDRWFEKFNRERMARIKRKSIYKKTKVFAHRASIVLFFFFLSITLLSVSVEGFRVRFFNMMVEKNDLFTSIHFKEKDEEVVKAKIGSNVYCIPYIPEGYELERFEEFGSMVITSYENDLGVELFFSQSGLETDYQLDTEDAIIETILIQGKEGMLVYKEGYYSLVWHNDVKSFYIRGQLKKDEIIRLASEIYLD